MKKISTTLKLTISILACLLFLSVGITLHTITLKQKNTLVESKKTIDSGSAENTFLLKQTAQRLDREIKQIESYFIDHTNAVGFIARLEEIAVLSDLNIDIQMLDVEEQTIKKKIKTIPENSDVNGAEASEVGKVKIEEVRSHGNLTMTIRGQGSWQATMTFLATLEKLNKKLVVEGLRLSSSVEESTGQTMWTSIFNLSGLTT